MKIEELKKLIREEVIDAKHRFALGKPAPKKDPMDAWSAIMSAISEVEELMLSLPKERHDGLDRVMSLLKSALSTFESGTSE